MRTTISRKARSRQTGIDEGRVGQGRPTRNAWLVMACLLLGAGSIVAYAQTREEPALPGTALTKQQSIERQIRRSLCAGSRLAGAPSDPQAKGEARRP